MAQTLTRILVHVSFSTKNRKNLITASVEPALHKYLGGIARSLESPALDINGTENHVHLVLSQSKNIALAELLKQFKHGSSKWIKTQGPDFTGFHWQDGYSGFLVSESQLETVRAYIRNQKEHHRTQTFEEELLEFLKRHNVAYDERYLWT